MENQLAEPDLIPARHYGELTGVDKQADFVLLGFVCHQSRGASLVIH